MKHASALMTFGLVSGLIFLSACTMQDETAVKPAPAPTTARQAEAKGPEEKAPAKAKAQTARGDVGLLDTEKNYMILVTKEGKLITLNFDQKTKVTQINPTQAKVEDIGLGSSATVTYTQQGNKNVASGLEYTPVKGGD